MLLAIDVGNTNSKFVVFDGDRIVAQWRLRTEAKRTADEYAAWLTQLMNVHGFDPRSITGAILASVVPQVNQHIRRLCESYFGNGLLIVGEPDCELGIKILIDRPQEAGADRLVGVIAGHTKYGGPLITVDFGSATTFDIADKPWLHGDTGLLGPDPAPGDLATWMHAAWVAFARTGDPGWATYDPHRPGAADRVRTWCAA